MASEADQANRLAWGSPGVIELFTKRKGFSGDAEAHAMRRVARGAKDQPILDLGVGGGRTVPFLRAVSADYVGIDYVEGLVRAARRRYSDARLECLDARDLSAFADETFGLVVFSRGGIDGLAHVDRPRVFSEVHRVLRPGGLFAYSTHNLDHLRASRVHLKPDWRRIAGHPLRALHQFVRVPRVLRDYRRLRTLDVAGDGWATVATLGYGFAVVWHRVTLAAALRELAEHDFRTIEVYGPDGLLATIDAYSDPTEHLANRIDTSGLTSLHLVAQKPRSIVQPKPRSDPRLIGPA